ncbi:hypothetical protein [Streptomyces sp. ITFR-16]|uniref:hypothetical protein n=1 Tax=Streptomyces sp. ITFR-16 TaxID=3075198 RepID=UPI00288AC363|nr:hypothetical protein [Streptomyces sp. ITFR-16]WNI23419.1 hypothetical protein RLT58_16425 [Streptomyces sp. ITFR-16]
MSAPEERDALLPRPSLYACAVRVRDAEPEGPWSRGYAARPDRPRPGSRAGRDWARTRDELTDLLTPLLVAADAAGAAEDVHRGLAAMDPPVRPAQIPRIVHGLPLENEARARALARCLVRTGSCHLPVRVGLALLARLGEPEDVPYLRRLGLLRDLVGPVVHALDAVDRPAAALICLRDREKAPELRALVAAIEAGDAAAVRERLAALPRELGPETARRAAEAARLAEHLRAVGPAVGEAAAPSAELVSQAGRLLFRMTSLRDYTPEILSYREAAQAYEGFVRGARRLTPTLDHCALLLSAAQELRSGAAVLHGWGPGRREALLAELATVLGRARWRAVVDRDGGDTAGRRRIAWARRVRGQLARVPAGRPRAPRIEIVQRDPQDPGTVETRILIDGRPLVPEVFGRGPAQAPEELLDGGGLRATDEPREVRLAEAYCTEGCCGALYVTIRRDGDEVVWSGWRCPVPPPSPLHRREIPEHRFDAVAYDAEIARAEGDQEWTWPARRTARLIAAGLRERPDLLGRWDLELDWSGTAFHDPDTAVVSLLYPGPDGHRRQYLWHVPEDGTPPQDRAAAALDRLAEADPRT